MNDSNNLYNASMDMRERIEQAAARAGYDSQTELAAACGVKQPSLFALLSGKYPMRKLLAKVAEITGVNERWLRFGDDDVRPPWALPASTAQQLQALTDRVAGSPIKASDPVVDLLAQLLVEQRAVRSLLEAMVAEHDAIEPRRRASIPRVASDAPAGVASTRDVTDG